MTLFDYLVLFVLICSVVIGTMRGLVKEVLSLLSWIAAFTIANMYGEQLARLLPEPAMLEALTRTAPLVPLRFLEEPAPDSQDQSLPPCAYLQLSAAYDAEAAQARRLHWPMERFDGHHLSLMTEPVGVAAMIIRLRKNLTPLLSTD